MVKFCVISSKEFIYLFIYSFSFLGCVAEYFNATEGNANITEECSKNLEAYKCALNSKASEDSMVCDEINRIWFLSY